MWEILAVLVVGAAIGGALWYAKRQNKASIPVIVEEYKLEQVEKEGFRKVIVKFQDVNGKVFPFEFQPNYLHAFSDDALRSAANALRPASVVE